VTNRIKRGQRQESLRSFFIAERRLDSVKIYRVILGYTKKWPASMLANWTRS